MPDLFEDYGALEYHPKRHPPKILDPRKAPFWILAGATALAVCLVLCLPLIVSKNAEKAAIARCRAALESFQELDSYYVRQENSFENDSALTDLSTTEFWRSGSGMLRRSQTLTLVRKDSAMYQCFYDETGTPAWTPSDVSRQLLLPWVAYYDWDSSATFLSREETEDGEAVTLQFTDTPYNSLPGVESYTVCFTLDEGGSLTCAVLTYAEETASGTESTVSAFHIGSESPEACAQAVDEAWQEAFGQNSGDWRLAQCQVALLDFQNLAGFHVLVKRQTDTELSSENTSNEFWRLGSDSMYVLTAKDGKNTGLLYQEGQWYSMASGLWGKGSMTGEDPWAVSWLAGFSWSDDIRFVSADSPGDTDAITVEFESAPDVNSLLSSRNERVTVTAVFTLDADGHLLRAKWSYTFYEYTVTEAWEVLSTDADEVYQTITEVASDAAGQIAADAPTLDRIQQALDEFRSLKDFHVVTQTTDTFPNDGTTNVTKSEYWRSGADGLEINYRNDMTVPSRIYLYKGDYVYSSYAGDHSWSVSKVSYYGGTGLDGGCHLSIPFLTSIDLDSRVTVLRGVEETGDGTAITVEFLNDSYNFQTMCFYLEPNGSLVSIEEKDSVNEGDNFVRESECLYRILPTDPEETAATIDAVYQEAYVAVYKEMNLKKCQDALTAFRTLSDYAIRWKISGGVSGRNDVYEKWHASGSGTYHVQTVGKQTTGLLYWQNQWYVLESGQWASASTAVGDFWTIPWLSDYIWNVNEMTLLSCEETDSGSVITFRLDGDTYWALDVSSYTVAFTLDENGSLTAAEITYKQNGSAVTCSYEILSTDAETVLQTIGDIWEEAARDLPADDEEGILSTPEL